MCRETSCIESHSKSGFASEFKGRGCRPQSLRPWITWVRILAEVRFFFFRGCTGVCFCHACSPAPPESPEVAVHMPLCVWHGCVRGKRLIGGGKARTSERYRDRMVEAQKPERCARKFPLPPQHGYLMTRDHGEALRFSHSVHSTSSFPSYTAIRETVLHVSAMYVASIKENIKKKAEAQSQKSKIYQKARCVLISATLKLLTSAAVV